jgi:sulfoxide reductase heme-binding subunit YedZ
VIDHALWYASRAAGLVTLLLFTATAVLGALGAARFATPRWPGFVIGALHRNVSLLGMGFLTVHVVTAVVDPYAGIGWWDVILPFRSVYRPFWLGLGAVAGDLAVAIVLTSLVRTRIGSRTWRVVHWASYACWPLAVIHGLGTGGADSHVGWVLVLDVLCVLAVAAALGRRFVVVHADTRVRRGGRVQP